MTEEPKICARLQWQGCTGTFTMIVPDEQLHFYRLCGTSMYSNVLGWEFFLFTSDCRDTLCTPLSELKDRDDIPLSLEGWQVVLNWCGWNLYLPKQLTDWSLIEVPLLLIGLTHISLDKNSLHPLGRDQSSFRLPSQKLSISLLK